MAALARVAEDALDGLAPHERIGGEVVLPDDVVGGAHHRRVAPLAGAQLLVDAMALGDVAEDGHRRADVSALVAHRRGVDVHEALVAVGAHEAHLLVGDDGAAERAHDRQLALGVDAPVEVAHERGAVIVGRHGRGALRGAVDLADGCVHQHAPVGTDDDDGDRQLVQHRLELAPGGIGGGARRALGLEQARPLERLRAVRRRASG